MLTSLLFLRWVEGMAPVFSRSAWHCAWHLIQNDLIHGWGMDMKLGYCAQLSFPEYLEFIHFDLQISLHRTDKRSKQLLRNNSLQIRRRSRSELYLFQERWDQAAREDKDWVDPFGAPKQKKQRPLTSNVP
ncbi:hypothetical protein GW17_00003649 [Ensete ventricosum]|nr:hypothetical protein GW17_00003649 [Ensete ventricosum]